MEHFDPGPRFGVLLGCLADNECTNTYFSAYTKTPITSASSATFLSLCLPHPTSYLCGWSWHPSRSRTWSLPPCSQVVTGQCRDGEVGSHRVPSVSVLVFVHLKGSFHGPGPLRSVPHAPPSLRRPPTGPLSRRPRVRTLFLSQLPDDSPLAPTAPQAPLSIYSYSKYPTPPPTSSRTSWSVFFGLGPVEPPSISVR